MLIGYARVSTDDQDLRLQHAALLEVGCKRVFEEKVSGAKRDRPELARRHRQLKRTLGQRKAIFLRGEVRPQRLSWRFRAKPRRRAGAKRGGSRQ